MLQILGMGSGERFFTRYNQNIRSEVGGVEDGMLDEHGILD